MPDKMPTFEWIPGQFVETNEDYNQDISVEDESIENLPNEEYQQMDEPRSFIGIVSDDE